MTMAYPHPAYPEGKPDGECSMPGKAQVSQPSGCEGVSRGRAGYKDEGCPA